MPPVMNIKKENASPTDSQRGNGGVQLPAKMAKLPVTGGTQEGTRNAHFEQGGVYGTADPFAARPATRYRLSEENLAEHTLSVNTLPLNAEANKFLPSGKKAEAVPAISYLNKRSTADEPTIVTSPTPANFAASNKANANYTAQQPIGGFGPRTFASRQPVFFSTDVGPGKPFIGSHYVKVEGVNPNETHDGEEVWDAVRDFALKSVLCGNKMSPMSHDLQSLTWYMYFDDLNDAAEVVGDDHNPGIAIVCQDWRVSYTTYDEYSGAIQGHADSLKIANPNTPPSMYMGQVIYTAEYVGKTSGEDLKSQQQIYDSVNNCARGVGEVVAFAAISSSPGSFQHEFRCEYYSINLADSAMWDFNQPPAMILGGAYKLTTRQYAPPGCIGHTPSIPPVWMLPINLKTDPNHDEKFYRRTMVYTPTKKTDKKVFMSPTGRTTWTEEEQKKYGGAPPPASATKQAYHSKPNGFNQDQYNTPSQRDRIRSAPDFEPLVVISPDEDPHKDVMMRRRTTDATGQTIWVDAPEMGISPQNVYVWKIRRGLDVRTTLMLRNIPNKWTRDELQGRLDATSAGRYDFFYLRFDFREEKNVGYAFVNFATAEDILPFHRAYIGKPWEPGSGKYNRVAEVSYATIQGFDCLVEKFRNSAIMEETPSWRPAIFFTDMTAPHPSMAGMELSFPGADNLSKKARSMDNAKTVGMFNTHNRGMTRDGRRHRSQFDKGTPAAMAEDAYYNQMTPTRGGYDYGYPSPEYAYGPRMPGGPPPPFPTMMQDNVFNQGPPYAEYGMGDGFGPFMHQLAAPSRSPRSQMPLTPFTPRVNNPLSMLRTHTNGRLGRPPVVSMTQSEYAALGGPVRSPENMQAGTTNNFNGNGAGFQRRY